MKAPEVRTDNDHPHHRDMYKTLNLLKIESVDGPVYFIVEGVAQFDAKETASELESHTRYFYEEHACPTNFIQIEAIFTPMDNDPHGVFEYVRSIWMPEEYTKDDAGHDGLLRDYFPETAEASKALLPE